MLSSMPSAPAKGEKACRIAESPLQWRDNLLPAVLWGKGSKDGSCSRGLTRKPIVYKRPSGRSRPWSPITEERLRLARAESSTWLAPAGSMGTRATWSMKT